MKSKYQNIISKRLKLLLLLLIGVNTVFAQVVYNEEFSLSSGNYSYLPASGNPWVLENTAHSTSQYIRFQANTWPAEAVLTTSTINLTGVSSHIYLSFKHICHISLFEKAYVEYSVDNGTSWTKIYDTPNTVTYVGEMSIFYLGNFNEASHTEWYPGSGSILTSDWWKTEKFEITSIVSNEPNVKFRFVLNEATYRSTSYYGWAIDNIKVESLTAEIVPPVISTSFQQIGPSCGDYKISANVTDYHHSVSSVNIDYSYVDVSGQLQSYGPFSMTLLGGIYTYDMTLIDACLITQSSYINYYITASDDLGNTSNPRWNQMYVTRPSNEPSNSKMLIPFTPTVGKEYVLSAWVKESVLSTNYQNTNIILSFVGATSSSNVTCLPKGQIIDGWQRIEVAFTIPATATNINIDLVNSGSSESFFDDIRIFPFDGNMKTYVYDYQTERFMAELDNNNYSTFYEYDEEGALIRVKKETSRGIMTIKENRNSKKK